MEELFQELLQQENVREREDLAMYEKFWPSWMAKRLGEAYQKSERSNS